MFTIVQKPRAWWPVTFLGVTEDGEVVTNKIEMNFFIMKIDELADFNRKKVEMSAEIEERLGAEDELTASRVGVELVKLIAGNWRGVAAEGVGEIPWNDENLRMLLDVTNALDGVIDAWSDCMAARQKVHEGN